MIVTAHDTDFSHFGLVSVSYPPKDIHTMALQATVDNIGALSLELHTELRYVYETGLPYVVFRAHRGTDEDPQDPASVPVRVGDWLVVLWDQLYVFRDLEFKTTFHLDGNAGHLALTDEQRFELREQEMRCGLDPAITVLSEAEAHRAALDDLNR